MRRSILITLAIAAVTLACGVNEQSCNGACYNPSTTSCLLDFDGTYGMCPIGTQICNRACYSPSNYHCVNGQLMGGAAPAAPASSTTQAAASPVTSTTATPVKITSSTTQAVATPATTTTATPVKTPTTTTQAAANPASTTTQAAANPATTTTATPATPSTTTAANSGNSGSTPCQTMFASLSCRTASEDPTKVDSTQVANARGWLCSTFPQYCTAIQNGGTWSNCNSVEQLSFAMTQYYNVQGPNPSACSFGGIGQVIAANTGASTTTQAAANPASTTTQAAANPASTTTQVAANPASTTTQVAANPASTTTQAAANPASTTTKSASTPTSASSSGAIPVSAPSPCYNGCPSGLCNCNGACYTSGQYNCPTDLITGSKSLCQANYALCNGQCFDSTTTSCVGGKLVSGASPVAVATTTAAPVVSPTPSPYPQFPTQNADLRIINSCKVPLWFEARYGPSGAPLPGASVTAQLALPGSYIDYTVPDSGLSGTRFWAKFGCDSTGKNCQMGDQMQYWPNPPGGCPAGGCTPPIDSLFEATWGCRPGTSCNSANPTTWFDTSQVDGWTIPYKVTPVGDASGCDCGPTGCGFTGIDASALDVNKCPSHEDLTASGQFPNVVSNGQTVSLSSVDLRIINNGSILGCMSPCKRLNWGAPYGLQQSESSGSPLWMCCPTPTPNNCTPANGCITSTACHSGPVTKTQYVSSVHTMAPGVYSYSYDDGVGLHACPAGVTKFTMEYCPSGSVAYPGHI